MATGYGDYRLNFDPVKGVLILHLRADRDWKTKSDNTIPYDRFLWKFVFSWDVVEDGRVTSDRKQFAFDRMRGLYVGLVRSGQYQCMFVQVDSKTVIASNTPGYEKGSLEELSEPGAFERW
ncbi:MAG TPA: hypothetical protein VF444_18800 [Pseudonocardiaceae bacterium]